MAHSTQQLDGAQRLNTSTCDDGRPVRPFTSDPALPGLSFPRILRSELAKLSALRSTLWLSLTAIVLASMMTALTIFSVGVMFEDGGFYVGQADADIVADLVGQGLMIGLYFSLILIGCVGVLAVTSEFGSGSIRSSLAAVPRRLPFVAAKALAVAVYAVVVGTLLIVGMAAALMVFASSQGIGVDLTDGNLWQVLGANLGVVVACALLGLGLGLVIRSSAGGIVVLAVLMFVAPMALNMLTTFTPDNEFLEFLATWQFGGLIDSVRNVGRQAEVMAAEGAEGLSVTAAAAGILGWLAVVLGGGAALFARRDV